MYLTPNSLSPYTSSRAIAGVRHSDVSGHGPGKPQGLGPDDGDDAAHARIDVQHPEIEKGYLREYRKRRGEPEQAVSLPGLYPVSRSAFSGELGWRCGTPESRWSLCRDTRSSPCMSAMTARPPFPSSNTRLFHDVVFAQPKLPGRVLRASPFDKAILQTPHVLTRFFQNTDGWCLFFPVHSSPPGSSYRQEMPDILPSVD